MGPHYSASLRKMLKKIEISQHATYTSPLLWEIHDERTAGHGVIHTAKWQLVVRTYNTASALCSTVCHQKPEETEGPVEVPPFETFPHITMG